MFLWTMKPSCAAPNESPTFVFVSEVQIHLREWLKLGGSEKWEGHPSQKPPPPPTVAFGLPEREEPPKIRSAQLVPCSMRYHLVGSLLAVDVGVDNEVDTPERHCHRARLRAREGEDGQQATKYRPGQRCRCRHCCLHFRDDVVLQGRENAPIRGTRQHNMDAADSHILKERRGGGGGWVNHGSTHGLGLQQKLLSSHTMMSAKYVTRNTTSKAFVRATRPTVSNALVLLIVLVPLILYSQVNMTRASIERHHFVSARFLICELKTSPPKLIFGGK